MFWLLDKGGGEDAWERAYVVRGWGYDSASYNPFSLLRVLTITLCEFRASILFLSTSYNTTFFQKPHCYFSPEFLSSRLPYRIKLCLFSITFTFSSYSNVYFDVTKLFLFFASDILDITYTLFIVHFCTT